MLGSLFHGLWIALLALIKSLAYLFIPIVIAIVVFLVMLLYRYLYYRYAEHIKPTSRDFDIERKTSFFENFFILWPKILAKDILTKNPSDFQNYGIHIVVGEQGSGKTMTVAYLLQEWKKRYPRLQIYTNMAYQHENGELSHWKQLINRNNGIYGVCNVIDEIKVWFSNRESSKVPPEVLGQICQLRKEKKALIGTVQVFSEMAKPLRSQTSLIYVPITIAGSYTIVRITKAKYYNEEKNCFKKYIGSFTFAHTEELRDAYDTYKKIEKYKDMDFDTPSSDLFRQPGEAPPVVEVPGTEKKKGK